MKRLFPTCWMAGWVTLIIVVATFGLQAASSPPKKTSASAPASKPKNDAISQNPYRGAIVIDAISGKVLFEDKADVKCYPASVLKLMHMLVIMEKIHQRQLSLDDTVVVSAKASKTGGSQVWLAHNETFTVDELLYALMVQSANDAAVALAEKVAGSTEAYVELMNRRARELNMTSTVFNSVHGLPPSTGQSPDITTPRDFAILCRELLRHHDTLRYTSTRERPFRPQAGPKALVMRTHNHLLGAVEGCDGLKTGYYRVAGYSIAATAARNGRRVIVVVLGSQDRLVRDARAKELMAKGFNTLATSSPTPASAATAPKKK